jgi:RNA polymerase sigma-54 factor
MKQRLQLRHSQRLRPTPRLQQSLRVLQCASLALRHELSAVVEGNPFLEHDHQSLNERSGNTLVPASMLDMMAANETLSERLKQQLSIHHLDRLEQIVTEGLIDCLDERGYLTDSFSDLQETLALPTPLNEDIFERCLQHIQQLEPIGVGARDLRECLLLQLEAQRVTPPAALDIALTIVSDHLPLMAEPNYDTLQKAIGVSNYELGLATDLVRKLNPRPGTIEQTITPDLGPPDLIAEQLTNGWHVRLHPANEHRLYLNENYWHDFPSNLSSEAQHFLKQQFRDARWWIRNLAFRYHSVLGIGRAIVEHQSDYLENRTAPLKPLTLQDIATTLNIHASTVSRAINQKTILAPRGMLSLKKLFSGHVTVTNSDDISIAAVKDYIREMIQCEQPETRLSDKDIAQALDTRGIQIARRTVAKYRNDLRILTASQRRKINAPALSKGTIA